jgi:hypothetical protein
MEGEKMKKIITSLSSALLILAASLSLTGIAKSAEFFTIGTGGHVVKPFCHAAPGRTTRVLLRGRQYLS